MTKAKDREDVDTTHYDPRKVFRESKTITGGSQRVTSAHR